MLLNRLFQNWMKLTGIKPRSKPRRGAHRSGPAVGMESLEDRRLLSGDPIQLPPSAHGVLQIFASRNSTQYVFEQLSSSGPATIRVTAQSATGELVLMYAGVLQIKYFGHEGRDMVENRSNVPLEAHGNGGDDSLIGGTGGDRLFGDGGNDVLFGRGGNDTLEGGLGNDRLSGDDHNDLLRGGGGNDSLFGNQGHDQLEGGDGADALQGDAGNDLLLGGNGNDTLRGGDGNDTLRGEAGNDSLFGEAGQDSLNGGSGNNTLVQ